MAEGARGDFEERDKELLSAIVGQGEAEEIGAARVGVFFIMGRGFCGELQKNVSGRELRK